MACAAVLVNKRKEGSKSKKKNKQHKFKNISKFKTCECQEQNDYLLGRVSESELFANANDS
jgi:hypothetical protein